MSLPSVEASVKSYAMVRRSMSSGIIVTTTHHSADRISAALDAGARDVLVKPFDPQRLASAMTRALRMAGTQRERDVLREQVDRQAQEFNALYTVGKTISGLLDIDEILTRVVTAAVNLTNAEQGSLLLRDPATALMEHRDECLVAGRGSSGDHRPDFVLSEDLLGKLAAALSRGRAESFYLRG